MEDFIRMPTRFRFTLRSPRGGQDNFFLWSMVILPIIAEGSYIFDAYNYLSNYSRIHDYQGLLSTVLVVFTYLRYCAPIESYRILGFYYVILCILNEAGTIGFLIVYIGHGDTFNTIIYIGWGLLELIMTGCLIYYRVHKRCHPTFHVESKHLFHFISRLELILAIFIPFFLNNASITLTKHSVAFFLLFDFFSESYSRFHGFWIKSILYLFVGTVTICVASEWVFKYDNIHNYEIVSSVFELVSGCLCDALIILQFEPYHLTAINITRIARDAFVFQQTIGTDLQTIEIVAEPTFQNITSNDAIINLVF